jgi:autoinducer 2-degrading protein
MAHPHRFFGQLSLSLWLEISQCHQNPLPKIRDTQMTAIVIHVELTLHAEHRDAYLARALQHKENVTAQEPGCQQFEISVEEDNQNVVRLYEVYDDEAAVQHHMHTSYMIAYREDTMPMIVERKMVRAVMAHG